MPSVSKKQHRFFEAIVHSPAFAKKSGVSRETANDFVAADKVAGKRRIKNLPLRKK